MRFHRSWCRAGMVMALGVLSTAGCSLFGIGGSGGGGDDVPGALVFGAPDTASRAAVLAYARAARYVSDLRLVDEQTLLHPGGRGPRARVEATVYAHRLTRPQLAHGALIGRFVSDSAYNPLGLRRGVQYLFVDSTGAGWRSIIIHDDAALPAKVGSLFVTDTLHHRQPGSLVPGARWIEFGGWIYPNIPCGKMCCVPCEPPLMNCPPSMGGWPPRLDPLSLEIVTTTVVP